MEQKEPKLNWLQKAQLNRKERKALKNIKKVAEQDKLDPKTRIRAEETIWELTKIFDIEDTHTGKAITKEWIQQQTDQELQEILHQTYELWTKRK